MTLTAVVYGLFSGFINLFLLPWHIWQWFQLETLKARMSSLTLAGQSLEFLYMVIALVMLIILLCLFSRKILKNTVLGLESFNRSIGKVASWFVLLMMIQQVMIIVVGQVFRGNEIFFSPFGMPLSASELQWLSGQLKFYNAILIAFASAYTFIEGGHVRVDLIYGALSHRWQRLVDFMGALVFMLPTTILLWWFAWPIATNSLFKQRPLNIYSDKASWRGMKYESSGTAEFTWVWAFKALILVFALLLFIQALTFLLRNMWALLEKDTIIEAHPVRHEEPAEPPASNHRDDSMQPPLQHSQD